MTQKAQSGAHRFGIDVSGKKVVIPVTSSPVSGRHLGQSGDQDEPLAFSMATHPLGTAGGIEDVVGTWERHDGKMMIDEKGMISGKSPTGCTLSGKVEKIDERFAGYRVNVETSDCELAGKFEGLAGPVDVDGKVALHLFVQNGEAAFYDFFNKTK